MLGQGTVSAELSNKTRNGVTCSAKKWAPAEADDPETKARPLVV